METLNEEINKLEKPEKRLENVSIDTVKELYTEMSKVQEETIRKIASCCNTDTIARLNRLIEEIQYNNERLNKLNKETEDLKLSLFASREIFEKKFKKANNQLAKKREKHKEDINELWNDNDQLPTWHLPAQI